MNEIWGVRGHYIAPIFSLPSPFSPLFPSDTPITHKLAYLVTLCKASETLFISLRSSFFSSDGTFSIGLTSQFLASLSASLSLNLSLPGKMSLAVVILLDCRIATCYVPNEFCLFDGKSAFQESLFSPVPFAQKTWRP